LKSVSKISWFLALGSWNFRGAGLCAALAAPELRAEALLLLAHHLAIAALFAADLSATAGFKCHATSPYCSQRPPQGGLFRWFEIFRIMQI
jgi:hypothetical protein